MEKQAKKDDIIELMVLWDFLLRSLNFITRYYSYPTYVFVYGTNYFRTSFKSHVLFYSHERFAEEIRKGRSIVRFGDGEMHIMLGGSIHYQNYEEGLSNAMRTMVREYDASSPYIIGLPVFINKSNAELKKEGKLFVWMPAKALYRTLFPKKATYGDAHFFYYDGFFKKYLEEYLLDRHLLVVSNQDSIDSFKHNGDIPFRKVSFVETPKKHSYSEYEKICSDIDSAIGRIPEGEKITLLLSTGPTSKQLVYDFSKKGIQSLDIGRGLEVFYRNESIEALFPELVYSKNENLS
jgi:hypothetical protein